MEMSYIFYHDTHEQIIPFRLLEDSSSEGIEIFNISIVEPIHIVGDSDVLNPAVGGPPLQIIVYDNDREWQLFCF